MAIIRPRSPMPHQRCHHDRQEHVDAAGQRSAQSPLSILGLQRYDEAEKRQPSSQGLQSCAHLLTDTPVMLQRGGRLHVAGNWTFQAHTSGLMYSRMSGLPQSPVRPQNCNSSRKFTLKQLCATPSQSSHVTCASQERCVQALATRHNMTHILPLIQAVPSLPVGGRRSRSGKQAAPGHK